MNPTASVDSFGRCARWILLSAGSGTRMGLSLPKTLALLEDSEVFLYSFSRALSFPQTKTISVPVGESHLETHIEAIKRFCRMSELELIEEESPHPEIWNARVLWNEREVELAVCPGGLRRQDSVVRGLKLLKNQFSIGADDPVLIHDCARPFLDLEICSELIQKCEPKVGAIPVMPMVDTVKEVKDGWVSRTVPRGDLYHVQTPQVFCFQDIHSVHTHPKWDVVEVTDDSQMAEDMGLRIRVVTGSPQMRKLTTGDDWQWAKTYLKAHPFGWVKVTTSIL